VQSFANQASMTAVGRLRQFELPKNPIPNWRNHIEISGGYTIGIDGGIWVGTGGGFQSESVAGLGWNMQEWWHRLAVRGTEYSIQGWKRERIYPDFLVKLEAGSGKRRYRTALLYRIQRRTLGRQHRHRLQTKAIQHN